MGHELDVAFTLIGVNDLLMKADDIEWADKLKEWQKDPSNKNKSVAGDDRTPPWTWQCGLYRNMERGVIAFPSDNVMVSLRKAAQQVTVPGKRSLTYKAASQSELVMSTEYCKFETAQGKEIQLADMEAIMELSFAEQKKAVQKYGFSLYVKRARIQMAKHVRIRARFPAGWRVSGVLHLDGTSIDLPQLEQFFTLAGKGGLGDWRPTSPSAPGPFGIYKAHISILK